MGATYCFVSNQTSVCHIKGRNDLTGVYNRLTRLVFRPGLSPFSFLYGGAHEPTVLQVLLPSPILGIPSHKGSFSGDLTLATQSGSISRVGRAAMHFYSITLVSTQNRQRRSAAERQDRGSSDHFGDLLEEHRSQGIKSSLGGERREVKIREDGPVRTGQE